MNARMVPVSVLLLGVLGCGGAEEDPFALSTKANLVAESVRELGCNLSCYPLRVEVCVTNEGVADAPAFTVRLNRTDRARIEGLAAGDRTCEVLQYWFGSTVEPDPNVPWQWLASFEVDAYDEVEEVSEADNESKFPQPSGTRCDIICGEFPTPQPTPPPPGGRSRT